MRDWTEWPQDRTDIAGRRAWLAALNSTAAHLNHLDTDDFGDDAPHGVKVIAWAVAEIQELDRLLALAECREEFARGSNGCIPWEDIPCGHDHARSALDLEPPQGRTYAERMARMAATWPAPSATRVQPIDLAADVAALADRYRIVYGAPAPIDLSGGDPNPATNSYTYLFNDDTPEGEEPRP